MGFLSLAVLKKFAFSKKGMRIMAIAGVALALLLALRWYGAKKVEEGRDKERDVMSDQIEDSLRQQQEVFEERWAQSEEKFDKMGGLLKKAERRELEADRRASQFASLAQSATAAINGIQLQRDQARSKIDSLTPDQYQPAIVAELGMRRADDANPSYYQEEEKEILVRVTDNPKLRSQLEETNTRVDALVGQVAELQVKGSASEEKFDALAGQLAARVEQLAASLQWGDANADAYTKVWNMLGKKKRSARCLYVWKCAPKRIDAPAPSQLLLTRPAITKE